ncbi:MAG TPA: HlyD family type I secretion periplasmic adaptor subunit [Alphaproteobacteria bacterium]|nr:HlyD family type I secretion periplasmic adaptor subunit [Alphaproteobacteria bacterium]
MASLDTLDHIPEPAEARTSGIEPVIWVGIAILAAFFAGLGGWSAVAVLDSAALAPGVVAVESSRKTIKHLEGGIVGEILIAEGAQVTSGQILIRLDQTRARAELEQLRAARHAAGTLAARLMAERDGLERIHWPDWPAKALADSRLQALRASQQRVFEAGLRAQRGQSAILRQKIAQSSEEIAGLEGEIASQGRQLDLIQQEIADLSQLLAKGLVDKPRVLALMRRQAEIDGERRRNAAAIARARQVIAEAEIRISELETARINTAVDALQEVERELFQLEQRIASAEDVLRRTEVRAPLAGRVVALKVHTIGGVIGAGEPLMEIVPEEERLMVEVQIDPGDVDMAEVGQTTELRFTAFHQRDLPPLEGKLVSISADRLVEEHTGRAYYLGRVELAEDPASLPEDVKIVPGMQAEAVIKTGEGTVLDYLLRPIERTFERAMRED